MRGTIEINLTNLKSNYLKIKEFSEKEIIGVIKSNAYGHGIIQVAKTLESCGCTSFLVATLEEALLLRNNNIKSNIIVLENTKNYYALFKNNLSLSISSIEELKDVNLFNHPLKLQLKIETGLNRLGLLISQLEEVNSLIKNSFHSIEGIYTHIQDETKYDIQEELFKKALTYFDLKNIKMIHINSSSYINHYNDYTTHIRVGLSLYGYSSILELTPILNLTIPIYRKIQVKKGDTIGYHNKGIAPMDGYIFTIPFGYADGWNNKYITLGYTDQIIEQIGSTCMDHMMFFSPTYFKENKIELISNNIPLLTQCKNNFASPYEILASLSSRIIRKYI